MAQSMTTRPAPPRLRRYLLGALGLTAVASGVLVVMVAVQYYGLANDAQALVSAEQRPVDSSAMYLEQMKLTQDTLKSFGYAPGASNGIMRFETAAALSAFQREQGLKITGQANPETLAALGIEDRLFRRPR
jgi:peptidoglycan hydrolase-like protein with peptidoglycan-binding domain